MRDLFLLKVHQCEIVKVLTETLDYLDCSYMLILQVCHMQKRDYIILLLSVSEILPQIVLLFA